MLPVAAAKASSYRPQRVQRLRQREQLEVPHVVFAALRRRFGEQSDCLFMLAVSLGELRLKRAQVRAERASREDLSRVGE